jgi:hypothetical protein
MFIDIQQQKKAFFFLSKGNVLIKSVDSLFQILLSTNYIWWKVGSGSIEVWKVIIIYLKIFSQGCIRYNNVI